MSIRSFRSSKLASATALALFACTIHAAAAEGRVNLATLDGDGAQTYRRFVVKYASHSAPRTSAAAFDASLGKAAAAASRGFAAGAGAVKLKRVRRAATGADVVVSDRALNRRDAESLMRKLAADPNVESVENDMRMVAYFTPNDTDFSKQYGFGSGNGGIRATTAWDSSTGAGVVVAVIDTGITNHSDLNANMIGGYDFISADSATSFFTAVDGDGRDADPADPGDWNDDDNECDIGDSSWHGSHVAGTVAAVTNNNKGVAGTAYGARVSPVRVLGRCGGYTSDIADAITWASGGSVSGVPANPNPADVINMSLGSRNPGVCSQVYKDAINGAIGRGTIVVVAAGNAGRNATTARDAAGDAVGYTMTNCGGVISVGSITSTGARSSFSNYGGGVDIAAPGSGIRSTINTGTKGPVAEGYASYDGTSMASPHVAGVAALVQSLAATPLSQERMRALLKSTARAFPSTPSQSIGAGIVDAGAAVAAVANGASPAARSYANNTQYAIPDNNTTGASSSVAVSGRSGKASANAKVAVDIVHPYKGDLKVDLLAPDGSVYNLHNKTGSTGDDVSQTYTVNLSSEDLNGTWKLRAVDSGASDVGTIRSWSVVF